MSARPAWLDHIIASYYQAQRTGDPFKVVHAETTLLWAIRQVNGTRTPVIEGRLVDQVLGGAR